MLSKLTSLNALQIKISFAAAYNFNQIHALCSLPCRFWPLPRRRFLALPLTAQARPTLWKNSFPVHPWYLENKPWDYFAYLERYLVASRQRYMNSCSPLPSAWDKVRIVKWQNWWGNKYMLIQVLWVCCFENWKELTFNTCHCCCPHVQTLTSCWEIIEITCFWPMWNDLAWRVMEITWIWRKHLRESDKLRRHDLWPGRDPYLMFGRLIQMWRRARSHTFRFALPIALGDKCALNETYRSNFSFAYSMSKCECFKEIGDLENVPDSGANFCMWRWVPMQFGTISDSDGAQQNWPFRPGERMYLLTSWLAGWLNSPYPFYCLVIWPMQMLPRWVC